MMEWIRQKLVRRRANLLGPLGGFAAILGFLLPFHGGRSLFSIMDGTTLPLLPQVVLLTLVAVILLYARGFIYVPCFFSTQLFIWMCVFYWTLFSRHPFGVVTANMQIGIYLIPAGLLGMLLHPLFSAWSDSTFETSAFSRDL